MTLVLEGVAASSITTIVVVASVEVVSAIVIVTSVVVLSPGDSGLVDDLV